MIISSTKPYHEQSQMTTNLRSANSWEEDGDRQVREVKSEVKLANLFFFLVVITLFFFSVGIVGVG